MNKNIIVVGAIAAGLYLLAQVNKPKKAVAKKKAPRRPKPKYLKPRLHVKQKTKRVIAKKKALYNKPKIKKAIAKKKITSTKPQKKKLNIKYHIPVYHPKRR